MNLHALLSDAGYDLVYETGALDYNIIEIGKKLLKTRKDVEIAVTSWDEEQVHIFCFNEDFFSIRRWVKK